MVSVCIYKNFKWLIERKQNVVFGQILPENQIPRRVWLGGRRKGGDLCGHLCGDLCGGLRGDLRGDLCADLCRPLTSYYDNLITFFEGEWHAAF